MNHSLNFNHTKNFEFESRYRGKNSDATLSYSDISDDPEKGSELIFHNQAQETSNTRLFALQSIESTVNELGSMYQQLANMISTQGELVQRIDLQLEDVQINMRRGRLQLERYLQNLSSNQWIMIKIFTIILVFIILLGAFLGSSND